MNVTEFNENTTALDFTESQLSEDEMQRNYAFLMVSSFMSNLHDSGFLTEEECSKVISDCRISLLSEISSLYE